MYALHVKIPAPAPKPRTGVVGKPAKYPFAQMDCFDSFFVPVSDFKNAEKAEEALKSRASGWLREHKDTAKFVFRVAAHPHPETGEACIGCWALPKSDDGL
jgi:hypothetical protein